MSKPIQITGKRNIDKITNPTKQHIRCESIITSIDEKIEIGKSKIIKEGKKLAILNFGARLNETLKASENLKKKGVKIDKKWLNYKEQLRLINCIYLDIEEKNINLLISDLKKKISGYKAQDVRKNILLPLKFITYEILLQKLVESKLKCYYCKKEMALIYENVRQMNQWTLDRINNNLGHNSDNVLISCLECNLKRKDIDKDKFLFTKQLKIKKEL